MEPNPEPPNPHSDPLQIPTFPDELLIETLSRLPAKSLLRFKSVSKSWLSLISCPQFIKTHLAVASERDDYGHHGLICAVSINTSDYQLELYSVNSLLYESTAIDNRRRLMEFNSKSLTLVGSCDGLVCIYNSLTEELLLWNPCLNKSKKLPESGMEKSFGCTKSFGFGYDELNGDYKVVGLFRTLIEHASIKVYSVKNNSWSDIKVGNKRAALPWWVYMHYVSGKLHWLLITDLRICGLDLADETYEEIDCPMPNHENMLYDSGMVVLGGCLSVFYEYGKTHSDIWVMKEYGVKDSWTKLVSIPYIHAPASVCVDVNRNGKSQPVCLLKNGEILFLFRSVLIIYDPKMKTFRRIPHTGPLENLIMYVETLVSPN